MPRKVCYIDGKQRERMFKNKGRAILLFESAIKSVQTRKVYGICLGKFLKWTGIKSFDELTALKPQTLQIMVEDYIIYLRKHLNPNSIPPQFAPIELFFSMNDIALNWKKIRKLFPQTIQKTGRKAWTTDDIRKMLQNTSDIRNRALIHFLASTGCRIGALPGLKMKHLSEADKKSRKAAIYVGSSEEYVTFLTPEANKALEEYHNKRKNDGEVFSLDTPVFRKRYAVGSAPVKPVTEGMLENVVARVIDSAGLTREKIGTRFEIQRAHGFRKRYDTILKLISAVNPNVAEKLLGHKNGLDGVYFVPTDEELFREFEKAITELTVDDTERLKIRTQKLEQEKSELEKKTEEIEGLKKKFDLDHDLVQGFARMLKDAGIGLAKPDGTPYEIDAREIDYCQKYGISKRENDPALRDL